MVIVVKRGRSSSSRSSCGNIKNSKSELMDDKFQAANQNLVSYLSAKELLLMNIFSICR